MDTVFNDKKKEYVLLAYYLGRQKLLNFIAIYRLTREILNAVYHSNSAIEKCISEHVTGCCLCKEKEDIFKDIWVYYKISSLKNETTDNIKDQDVEQAWSDILKLWFDVKTQSKTEPQPKSNLWKFEEACKDVMARHKVTLPSHSRKKLSENEDCVNWLSLIHTVETQLTSCISSLRQSSGAPLSKGASTCATNEGGLTTAYATLSVEDDANDVVRSVQRCRTFGIKAGPTGDKRSIFVKYMICAGCFQWEEAEVPLTIVHVLESYVDYFASLQQKPECVKQKKHQRISFAKSKLHLQVSADNATKSPAERDGNYRRMTRNFGIRESKSLPKSNLPYYQRISFEKSKLRLQVSADDKSCNATKSPAERDGTRNFGIRKSKRLPKSPTKYAEFMCYNGNASKKTCQWRMIRGGMKECEKNVKISVHEDGETITGYVDPLRSLIALNKNILPKNSLQPKTGNSPQNLKICSKKSALFSPTIPLTAESSTSIAESSCHRPHQACETRAMSERANFPNHAKTLIHFNQTASKRPQPSATSFMDRLVPSALTQKPESFSMQKSEDESFSNPEPKSTSDKMLKLYNTRGNPDRCSFSLTPKSHLNPRSNCLKLNLQGGLQNALNRNLSTSQASRNQAIYEQGTLEHSVSITPRKVRKSRERSRKRYTSRKKKRPVVNDGLDLTGSPVNALAAEEERKTEHACSLSEIVSVFRNPQTARTNDQELPVPKPFEPHYLCTIQTIEQQGWKAYWYRKCRYSRLPENINKIHSKTKKHNMLWPRNQEINWSPDMTADMPLEVPKLNQEDTLICHEKSFKNDTLSVAFQLKVDCKMSSKKESNVGDSRKDKSRHMGGLFGQVSNANGRFINLSQSGIHEKLSLRSTSCKSPKGNVGDVKCKKTPVSIYDRSSGVAAECALQNPERRKRKASFLLSDYFPTKSKAKYHRHHNGDCTALRRNVESYPEHIGSKNQIKTTESSKYSNSGLQLLTSSTGLCDPPSCQTSHENAMMNLEGNSISYTTEISEYSATSKNKKIARKSEVKALKCRGTFAQQALNEALKSGNAEPCIMPHLFFSGSYKLLNNPECTVVSPQPCWFSQYPEVTAQVEARRNYALRHFLAITCKNDAKSSRCRSDGENFVSNVCSLFDGALDRKSSRTSLSKQRNEAVGRNREAKRKAVKERSLPSTAKLSFMKSANVKRKTANELADACLYKKHYNDAYPPAIHPRNVEILGGNQCESHQQSETSDSSIAKNSLCAAWGEHNKLNNSSKDVEAYRIPEFADIYKDLKKAIRMRGKSFTGNMQLGNRKIIVSDTVKRELGARLISRNKTFEVLHSKLIRLSCNSKPRLVSLKRRHPSWDKNTKNVFDRLCCSIKTWSGSKITRSAGGHNYIRKRNAVSTTSAKSSSSSQCNGVFLKRLSQSPASREGLDSNFNGSLCYLPVSSGSRQSFSEFESSAKGYSPYLCTGNTSRERTNASDCKNLCESLLSVKAPILPLSGLNEPDAKSQSSSKLDLGDTYSHLANKSDSKLGDLEHAASILPPKRRTNNVSAALDGRCWSCSTDSEEFSAVKEGQFLRKRHIESNHCGCVKQKPGNKRKKSGIGHCLSFPQYVKALLDADETSIQKRKKNCFSDTSEDEDSDFEKPFTSLYKSSLNVQRISSVMFDSTSAKSLTLQQPREPIVSEQNTFKLIHPLKEFGIRPPRNPNNVELDATAAKPTLQCQQSASMPIAHENLDPKAKKYQEIASRFPLFVSQSYVPLKRCSIPASLSQKTVITHPYRSQEIFFLLKHLTANGKCKRPRGVSERKRRLEQKSRFIMKFCDPTL